MKLFILIVHLVISLALIGLVLLQSGKGGLSGSFVGGEFYRSKRGAERLVFMATIAVGGLFLLTSILNLVLR